MSLAPLLSVRALILSTLKTDAISIIPAARWYPSKTPASPTWPFGRLDSLTAVPSREDCASQADVAATLHVFTKLDVSLAPDPEAQAAQIMDEAAAALDALEDCTVESTQVIMDSAEADAFHGILRLRFLRG
jgi:hypothetical protein